MTRSLAARAVTVVVAVGGLMVASTGAYATAAKQPKPKPTAAGSLAVAFTYPLPYSTLTRFRAPVVAEAPDGAVFFASGTRVYRVASDGTTLAAQVGDRIYAIAASSTLLVVETPADVIAYSRATGKRVGGWDVEEAGAYPPALVVGGGVIWSMIDAATSDTGLEPATLYELRPGHQERQITDQATATTPVVDDVGDAFFVTFAGRLERVTPSGATHVSADSAYSAAVLAYVDDTLVAEIDTASTVIDEIDPTTLGVVSSHSGTAGDFADSADTTIGVLSLSSDCDVTYCSNAGVRRIELPDTRGPALSVPYGAVVMGPQPRVLEQPSKGKFQLVGLRLA